MQEEFVIIGTDSDKYNLLLGCRYAKKVYLAPKANDYGYIDALRKLVKREGVDVVIPSPDPEVLAITKHKRELGATTFLPSLRTVEVAQDKWLAYKILEVR